MPHYCQIYIITEYNKPEETKLKKNILLNLLSKINYRWQNFIEKIFGMGNLSSKSYKDEQRKNYKI
jgi:hypothetical protein